MMTAEETQAYQRGYSDATSGAGESDNPYSHNSAPDLAEAYDEGFNEGTLYLEDRRCEALELHED